MMLLLQQQICASPSIVVKTHKKNLNCTTVTQTLTLFQCEALASAGNTTNIKELKTKKQACVAT